VTGSAVPTLKAPLEPRPPRVTRLDWYIANEILPLLLGGLFGVIVVLIMGFAFEKIGEFLSKGANPLLILQYLAFRLPEMISLGLPLSMLFAVLMGFSRLTQDSELKAAITSGITPTRLVMPVLAIGAVVSVAAFVNGETLKPRAFVEAQRVFKDIVLSNPRIAVQDGQFFKDSQNQVIYIEPGGLLDNGELRNVTVLQAQTGQVPSAITRAATGQILRDEGAIELLNGTRTTYRAGDARPVTIARFERAVIPIKQLRGGGNLSREPVQLPLPELIDRIRTLEGQGLHPNAEWVGLNRKFADPLAAMAFAVFGIGMGLWMLKSNQNLGFVGAMLFTFLYYATTTVFRVMGENGALPAFIGAWAADVLYVAGGLVLLYLARDR
jgi:lipopolysaccharide export system permease protein